MKLEWRQDPDYAKEEVLDLYVDGRQARQYWIANWEPTDGYWRGRGGGPYMTFSSKPEAMAWVEAMYALRGNDEN